MAVSDFCHTAVVSQPVATDCRCVGRPQEDLRWLLGHTSFPPQGLHENTAAPGEAGKPLAFSCFQLKFPRERTDPRAVLYWVTVTQLGSGLWLPPCHHACAWPAESDSCCVGGGQGDSVQRTEGRFQLRR